MHQIELCRESIRPCPNVPASENEIRSETYQRRCNGTVSLGPVQHQAQRINIGIVIDTAEFCSPAIHGQVDNDGADQPLESDISRGTIDYDSDPALVDRAKCPISNF